MTINDLPVGRDVDETLRLVQAFQYTDKHGEVCPAGWKPGKATMVPNPKDSQTYFQQIVAKWSLTLGDGYIFPDHDGYIHNLPDSQPEQVTRGGCLRRQLEGTTL